MKKFLSLSLVLILLCTQPIFAQTSGEQRWFNYTPYHFVVSVFDDNGQLGYLDSSMTVFFPGGATLSLKGNDFSYVAMTGSTLFLQDYSGNVKVMENGQWKTLGAYDGISFDHGVVWVWKGNHIYSAQKSAVLSEVSSVPARVISVTGTSGRAIVSTAEGVNKCTGSSCQLVDERVCDMAWVLSNNEIACLRSDVLSVGNGEFYNDVTSVSFYQNVLYFISANHLQSFDGERHVNIATVPPNTLLEGGFLVQPSGTFELKGTTLTKYSSQIRAPFNGKLLPGPALAWDSYRMTYSASSWTDQYEQTTFLRSNGMLSWESGGSSYEWNGTVRTVKGTIFDGFGDMQEGYLLVRVKDNLNRPRVLVVDASSGKPLYGFQTTAIMSYGYTGEGYFISTADSIKLLSLGTISNISTELSAEHVAIINGVTYYSSGNYLVGPKTYKFQSPIQQVLPSDKGVLVRTASSIYLVSSGDIKDVGIVYGNYPKNVESMVSDNGNIFLLAQDGVYGLMPQVHVVFQVGNKSYSINDVTKNMDVTATIINGRTMVPIRVVSEAFGYSVGWDESQKMVTISGMGHIVELWSDSTTAMVDGGPLKVDASPQIIDGVMVVPVRFIVESMGLSVAWSDSTRKVEITLP
ncbi:copper amine oxidase N-terminal domain-containing protein [Coprothermobacter platensis]|uniref:copper amine oxidase N-terminal domain-containing protein n=1 Tax=Coprothermobacter platensis TaxID=108819 RepID=UPI00037B8817|nr:copper amine oxidase N-terminal domain-containing protein [Coprothermobacter platensis]